MEKKEVKILCFTEVEDNVKCNLLVITDESVFGTDAYKQKIDDLLGTIFDIDHELDLDILEEYKQAVEDIVNGKDGYYLDYELYYEGCEVA